MRFCSACFECGLEVPRFGEEGRGKRCSFALFTDAPRGRLMHPYRDRRSGRVFLFWDFSGFSWAGYSVWDIGFSWAGYSVWDILGLFELYLGWLLGTGHWAVCARMSYLIGGKILWPPSVLHPMCKRNRKENPKFHTMSTITFKYSTVSYKWIWGDPD